MKRTVLLLNRCESAVLFFKDLYDNDEIVSEEIIRTGEAFILKNAQNRGLKTWADKYFMFVNSRANGLQTSNLFGGGTYELIGNAYTKNIEQHVA